ncbi:hypothetical protein POM88_015520 [Heracleum sosnowskyi]|uniref:VOC domain-containing protein n=1 Tax=Heracleum sosnowskyi TaxID=360622 RepID=A0AAD8IN22_9APIA|nr:hypothetical protein POM88_015520 [Heracleum sosnowskyi]
MAESEAKPVSELLEWPNKDKRRFLHAVYRVGDLDRTINFRFFVLTVIVHINIFRGDYEMDKYDIGTGFGHFAIATSDVYKFVENARAKGGNVSREPGPVKGGSSKIAFVKDPDGYAFEIIQRASTPEPLCQVMLEK